MGVLDGRVAIITGAGNGLGREYALLFASEGARLVVNDLGVSPSGAGEDPSVVNELVKEIEAIGGEAIATTGDVAEYEVGRQLVETAVEAFGDLHVVINSAGVLRPTALPEMTEEDWDLVVDVSLKGAFNTTRWAASYWADQVNDGKKVHASVVHNCSPLGGPPVQAQRMSEREASASGDAPIEFFTLGVNHWAAKGGAVEFMLHSAAELALLGIRSNAVMPSGFTRLTTLFPLLPQIEIPKDGFHPMRPANNAPLVAWLAMKDCTASGKVFSLHGGEIALWTPWAPGPSITKDGCWELPELEEQLPALLSGPAEK